MKRIIFTCGDINGIGPEISLKVFQKLQSRGRNQFIFICPGNALNETKLLLKSDINFKPIDKIDRLNRVDDRFVLFDAGTCKINPGKPTLSSGKASVKALEIAMRIVKTGLSNTIITAPISKEAVLKAGFKFPGHTEFFASASRAQNFLMMFVSKNMKAALATIHEPLFKVPQLINMKSLQKKLDVLINTLKKDFGIIKPKIAVLGLNPHAGENGKIGVEENKILIPVLKKYQKNVGGPFVPDAFFGMKKYKDYDCVVGMYHDQVLIPFKMLNFNTGVNFTAGLNFVRTSPDHGTAYDIAWQNKADHLSMMQAYIWAEKISKNRSK